MRSEDPFNCLMASQGTLAYGSRLTTTWQGAHCAGGFIDVTQIDVRKYWKESLGFTTSPP